MWANVWQQRDNIKAVRANGSVGGFWLSGYWKTISKFCKPDSLIEFVAGGHK
jgi:hypothetical protein